MYFLRVFLISITNNNFFMIGFTYLADTVQKDK